MHIYNLNFYIDKQFV